MLGVWCSRHTWPVSRLAKGSPSLKRPCTVMRDRGAGGGTSSPKRGGVESRPSTQTCRLPLKSSLSTSIALPTPPSQHWRGGNARRGHSARL